ncbi:methyltransferase domain-containing protein [Candidatus Uhrbacteria bacterium]|nr:methyltransferase domain-containing protein [Candidatus Uhrbacteria bacterium]
MKSQVTLKGGTALLDASKVLKRLDIKDSYVVADLGCGGGGHFIAPSARIVGESGKVYAIDIQKRVLASLKSQLAIQDITNVELVWSDLEKYGAAKIPNGSCDVVIIINVLFQNTKHDLILKEAKRFLRPGGRLAVIDWKEGAQPFGPPAHLRVPPQKIRELAYDVGELLLIDDFDAGRYHYVLVFRRD